MSRAPGIGGSAFAAAPAAASQHVAPHPYELRGLLGSGGFATVREAWDARLQRVMAIKCIALGGDSQAWQKERPG